MIKFFRIIRRQLVKENKVSKYLLYAVGEILLVIIGMNKEKKVWKKKLFSLV